MKAVELLIGITNKAEFETAIKNRGFLKCSFKNEGLKTLTAVIENKNGKNVSIQQVFELGVIFETFCNQSLNNI
jgi:hypothetical protein